MGRWVPSWVRGRVGEPHSIHQNLGDPTTTLQMDAGDLQQGARAGPGTCQAWGDRVTPAVLPRSTATSSPVRPAATFPPAAHCPLGSALDGVYPPLSEPVLLPKEASRGTRAERARAEPSHAFLTKPPTRSGLEPASSPGKGSEPRPPAPPASGHTVGRTPAKSLAQHHASPEPPAASAPATDPHREKTPSKPFSIQELELRSLGKTTLTAATFIDAVIMRQIAHDKGPREGPPAAGSPPHGKLRPPPPPVAPTPTDPRF